MRQGESVGKKEKKKRERGRGAKRKRQKEKKRGRWKEKEGERYLDVVDFLRACSSCSRPRPFKFG